MGPKFKVGDQVGFKQDVEGHGTVVDVQYGYTMFGDIVYDYTIKVEDHREARYNFAYKANVVQGVPEEHVWKF